MTYRRCRTAKFPKLRVSRESRVSVRIRKSIEEVFGWLKTVGGLRKTRHRGTARVGWTFTFVAAAYNVVRIPKLLAGTA